uniref:Cell division protein FtsZ n=1 Tax=candidate division WOR-3 bacterium TaxID=2052148 RepID=A0A7C4YH37_UNCW3
MFSVPESPVQPAKIKVIGVGGCGGNVCNYLYKNGIKGVEIYAVNTDIQALSSLSVDNKIQIGENLTKGRGTGGEPDLGKEAANESYDKLKEIMMDANLVFITAGMGGGTGTGASPVVASVAKEIGALTIAVVTKPFEYENKMEKAMRGIEELKQVVDSILIIPNQKLLSFKNVSLFELLQDKTADVPAKAVQGISDLIVNTGYINRDFEDLKKVMTKRGKAVIGIGEGSGENKAVEAAQTAISSPLLEDIDISKAKSALINITSGRDLTSQEFEECINLIRKELNNNIEIFFGFVPDDNMNGKVRITLIATGIEYDTKDERMNEIITKSSILKPKVVITDKTSIEDLEIPTYLRRNID